MPLSLCPHCRRAIADEDTCAGCGLDLAAVRAMIADLMKPLEQRYADQSIKSIALRRELNAEREAVVAVLKRTGRVEVP